MFMINDKAMQSQLEAALLAGHGSGTNQAGDDEEKEEHDEDADDVDEDIDEDCDVDIGHRVGKSSSCSNISTSRTVTLQMLLAADILQPAEGSMSIEYMGQRFVGDLLEDGKIRSQETDIVFASPSAWAIACKRFINPDKKSGCGWSSVKYKGRKLEVYKNLWYKKRVAEMNKRDESEDETTVPEAKLIAPVQPQFVQRIVVKHNAVSNRTFTHDANTLIECMPFSSMGKIQPFLLTISTNAALLLDFHCHLTGIEVSGYLAGLWDYNSQNLQVTHAFPCRNTKVDRENAPQVEMEIQKAIEKLKLVLVGWYHSHPFTPATPTLRDIDAQLDYQIKMKGSTDNNYTPCIGIIISPYNYDNGSLESSIMAYWVIPPPENKPNEYGRPMQMSYSVSQDSDLSPLIKDEMSKCVEYYKKQNELIMFTEKYLNNTTFIEKLKNTLLSKFPKDQTEVFWAFIRELLGCGQEADAVITIPQIPQVCKTTTSTSILPPLNPPSVNLNRNLMLTSDIANVLFNSGKFPSASSILGLPDPMAHSTLAANNMFLQTNMFKMQDILKPVSTSSPKGKEKPIPPLKIPTDLKSFTQEFYKNLQSETDLGSMNSGCKVGKSDLGDLSLMSSINTTLMSDKSETSGAGIPLSLSQAAAECSLDLSQCMPRIDKIERSLTDSLGNSMDLSAITDFATTNLSANGKNDNEPMNLAAVP